LRQRCGVVQSTSNMEGLLRGAAKIKIADVGMSRKLLRRPVQANPAGVQQVGVVAAFQRKLYVLLDKQDGDAGPGKIQDDVEDLLDDLRCKTERWLVKHQQLRLGHQRAADGKHLLLAAGHAAGHAVTAFFQDREKLEDLVPERLEGLAATADMRGHQIFLDGQPLEDLPALGAVGKAHAHHLFRPRARDRLAVELDGSRGGLGHAGNGVQQCGLAGAVRPEDDDDLAFIDLEIDAFKNADASVSRAEPGDLEQRP